MILEGVFFLHKSYNLKILSMHEKDDIQSLKPNKVRQSSPAFYFQIEESR